MLCKQCNVDKPEEEFPRNKGKVSGRGTYCNACMYLRLKDWRSRNPEKMSKLQKARYRRIHGQSSSICSE